MTCPGTSYIPVAVAASSYDALPGRGCLSTGRRVGMYETVLLYRSCWDEWLEDADCRFR
jgi:hypothetical protein